MTSYTENDILAALDEAQAGECWEWPDFGHLDYDTLTAPMVVLRDEDHWAIVFCAVEWDTDNALTATIMPVGNCVQIPQPKNYQQLQARYATEVRCEMETEGEEIGPEFEREMAAEFDQELGYLARRLDSVKLEYDFDNESLEERGYVSAVRVRGEQVDLATLTIEPDNSRDAAFAIGLAAVRKYRDQMLANAGEAARFFPHGMPPVFMVIAEWHYSKWVRPSKTEVFQQIARAIAGNDPACYAPTREPNTEWQIGVEADWEDDAEEEDEQTRSGPSEATLAYMMERMPPPTEDERKIIDEIAAAYKAPTVSTEPLDRDACIAAFGALYAARQHAAPQFVFCSSPRDFQERVRSMVADGQSVEDVAGAHVSLGEGPGLDYRDRDAKRINGIVRYLGEQTRPYYDLAECVDQAESACIPKAVLFDAIRCATTARLMDYGIAWEAAHTLGMQGNWQTALTKVRAAYTCAAYGTYERYCFIIDRPLRIEHPDLTSGAPEGRCRVEWRDGYAYDLALDEDE